MVTLITEKLQNQSLDDLTCKTYNINLVRMYQNCVNMKIPCNQKQRKTVFKSVGQPDCLVMWIEVLRGKAMRILCG